MPFLPFLSLCRYPCHSQKSPVPPNSSRRREAATPRNSTRQGPSSGATNCIYYGLQGMSCKETRHVASSPFCSANSSLLFCFDRYRQAVRQDKSIRLLKKRVLPP